MNTSESFRALGRANPRRADGFAASVEAAADAVNARIGAAGDVRVPRPRRGHRRFVGVSAAGVAVAVAAVVAVAIVGSPGGGPAVENATAAVRKATTLTAAAAERSGTAVVHMTHNDRAWAGKTVRWHGDDVAVSRDTPSRTPKVGDELLLVDGLVYGIDSLDGSWIMMGSPANIDPDSGTTPDEYLAAVREDVGGATLRRITGGMKGLTTRQLADGSTVYEGTLRAGLVARETGFKEGQRIRVLPFGYVANEAVDPASEFDAAVTVGADGIVGEVRFAWGTSASAWTYTVTYSGLGATAPVVAPANARSLLEERRRGRD